MQEPLTTQPHFINKITLIDLLRKHSEEMQIKEQFIFIQNFFSWNSVLLTNVSNLLELPSKIIKFYVTKIKSAYTSLTAAELNIKQNSLVTFYFK